MELAIQDTILAAECRCPAGILVKLDLLLQIRGVSEIKDVVGQCIWSVRQDVERLRCAHVAGGSA